LFPGLVRRLDQVRPVEGNPPTIREPDDGVPAATDIGGEFPRLAVSFGLSAGLPKKHCARGVNLCSDLYGYRLGFRGFFFRGHVTPP
jgi:hypothetical protein